MSRVARETKLRQRNLGRASRARRGSLLVGRSTTRPGLSPSLGLDISPVWESVSSGRGAAGCHRDSVLSRALALADVLAAYLALTIAVEFVGPGSIRWRPSVVVLAPLVVVMAKAIGLYDRDRYTLRNSTIDEVPSLVYLTVLYALTIWLAESVLFHGWLSRAQVFVLLALSFVTFVAGRLAARAATRSVSAPERCIVVGKQDDAARISLKLQGSPGVRAEVVGRVALDNDDDHVHGPFRASGSLSRPGSLARAIVELQVERVIIAPDSHDQEEILDLIRLIKTLSVKVSVLPRLLEVVGSSSIFDDVDGLTLLGVRQFGASRSSQSLKRLMDVAGALVGLVTLTPLFVMLAVAIRADSRGPVFFRQRRIGRRGEVFSMLKFRTMAEDADAIKMELLDRNEATGGLFKITDDPRITRVGRFLRRSSIDELPQLLNVLAGDMSLVGPRPLVEDEDALIEGWQRRRLAVKPGMTGMWQIFGSSRIPMNEMVKIDYLYGANWSVWLDLKILLKTVPYMARRRGL
jgi:exopolysaccharide biosynthesis polyprenyl glycosylphosphotransferase